MTATTPPGAERYLYHRAGAVRLYLGDAATVLAALPPSCVDCVVTSPPYWGHRDYATGSWAGGDPGCPHPPGRPTPGSTCPSCAAVYTDPQLGRETTLDAYVANLVAVFTQIRRILAADGTCWVNLGDSYSTAAGGAPAAGRPQPDGTRPTTPSGRDVLPAKNLLGVPWRLAFALQADGWWLRQAVIWHKPNAMPESVADRTFCNYEYLFLLTKSPRYHFNLDPIRVPLAYPDAADGSRVFGGARKAGPNVPSGAIGASARRRGNTYTAPKYAADPAGAVGRPSRGNLVATGTAHTAAHPRGRNPGSVWSIPTRPNRLAHFAAFPIDLPWRAIAAGCKPAGTVCDPFAGISTTGLAAVHLGRSYLGVDVNPAYHDLALRRLAPLPTPDPTPLGDTS